MEINLNPDTIRNIEYAEVASIDSATGQVGLYLRNQTRASGVYLGDVNTLAVGDVVMVTRISEGFVILNKVRGYLATDARMMNAPTPATGGSGGSGQTSHTTKSISGNLTGYFVY